MPSQINDDPNNIQNMNINLNENNEVPNYPKLDNNNNKDNKGFSENLDWSESDVNSDINLQNKQNFNNINNIQEIEVKNKEKLAGSNDNNNEREGETYVDTLDESVCETIVIINNINLFFFFNIL